LPLCFLDAAATTALYTLSLHDALPIFAARGTLSSGERLACSGTVVGPGAGYLIPSDRPPVSEVSASIVWEGIHRYFQDPPLLWKDRKSTRLNSSHVKISYAVFCLKKKNR